MDFIEGEILVFDKPYQWTSFDLVRKVRNSLTKKLHLKKLKVGHAGTLDPLATGVLVICTGRATKQIDTLQAQIKEYIATIEFGRTTPSFDLEKETDAVYPYAHITREALEQILQQFTGKSNQIPPLFSAKNLSGRRAYEFAREGSDMQLEAKPIEIYHLSIVSFELPTVVVRVTCSKGTYIRSLARDLGLAMQSGACLTGLRRTRSGDYSVEEALTPEAFEQLLQSEGFVL